MKYQRSGLFRYIIILFLVIALVRFFPVMVRMFQAAAIGVRGYWWAILRTNVFNAKVFTLIMESFKFFLKARSQLDFWQCSGKYFSL